MLGNSIKIFNHGVIGSCHELYVNAENSILIVDYFKELKSLLMALVLNN